MRSAERRVGKAQQKTERRVLYSAFRTLHLHRPQHDHASRGAWVVPVAAWLWFELGVPVCFADELAPAGDRGVPRGVQWLPLGPAGLGVELHVSLARGAVGLFLVALDAGQDAVFPGARSTTRP